MRDYYIGYWGDVFTKTPVMGVPDGYELIEKEDHKKQRLEKERETLTSRKKMLLGLLDEVDLRFKEIKVQLNLPAQNKK